MHAILRRIGGTARRRSPEDEPLNAPEPVQLLDYLRAVRQRWWLVLLIALIATGCALGISLSAEKQYDATAHLLLRGEEPINSLLDPTANSRSSDPERDLNTELELMKVGGTAYPVLRRLDLQRSADELLSQIEPTASSQSNIVALRVRDRDPRMAARIANAFAEEYVRYKTESARARYREAAELAQRQLEGLAPEEREGEAGRELQARQRELQVAAELQTGGVELVRRATPPTSASRPRPKLSAAVGLALGLLLGVAAALALNLGDRRLKDEDDVEALFGLPILATIPRPARRSAKDDPAQREAYGLLTANLRLTAGNRAGGVILITSPSPADGKTSVTLGIARAYARLGLDVVAVEADLRRPAFGRYLDASASEGVTGVLSGGPVSDEVLWLDPETLRPADAHGGSGSVGILPAGDLPANPQRVLADPRMQTVFDVLQQVADVVLVDSAPVGTVNDASMLAPLVDAVVLVARLNRTTRDASRRALRALRNETNLLGVVVTDAGGGARHAYYPAKPTSSKRAVAAKAGRGEAG